MVTTKIQKEYLDDELPHILSGAGAPASTPAKIGNIYVDTTSGSSYIAKGTSSSADWKITGGSSTDISCRVKQTGATTLGTAGNWVACAFAAEDFDTDTMHDNATNNTRITFTTAGKYMVGGVIGITTNSVCLARIRLNGTTVISGQGQGNSGQGERANVTTIYSFSASDYIELQGQGTGNNSTGDAETNFWAYKIA